MLFNYFLICKQHNLNVYVEEKDYKNDLFITNSKKVVDEMGNKKLRIFLQSSLSNFSNETNVKTRDNCIDKIDLIICLGGDGTILYASTLFQVGFKY